MSVKDFNINLGYFPGILETAELSSGCQYPRAMQSPQRPEFQLPTEISQLTTNELGKRCNNRHAGLLCAQPEHGVLGGHETLLVLIHESPERSLPDLDTLFARPFRLA